MKMILLIFFLGISSYCYSMKKIKLPEENILDDRLADLNLEYFNEKAGVAKKLGNLECTPSQVLILFDQMIENFKISCKNDEFGNYSWVKTIQRSKLKILKSILQEHPQAVKCLMDHNLILGDE